MSQREIYQLIKDDFGGKATLKQILNKASERYPILFKTRQVYTNLSRLKVWGFVSYHHPTRTYTIVAEFDTNISK